LLENGVYVREIDYFGGSSPSSPTQVSFGTSLAASGNILAVGDPGASTVSLFEIIKNVATGEYFVPIQTISPTYVPCRFAGSLAMEDDVVIIGDCGTGQ
jgi:hypothetical protein